MSPLGRSPRQLRAISRQELMMPLERLTWIECKSGLHQVFSGPACQHFLATRARLSTDRLSTHHVIHPKRHAQPQFVTNQVQSLSSRNTFSSTGRSGPKFGEIKMFTASNRTSRLASFTFAVFMVVAINGSILMKFDSAATSASLAQNVQPSNLAVLETVTIVGHRI